MCLKLAATANGSILFFEWPAMPLVSSDYREQLSRLFQKQNVKKFESIDHTPNLCANLVVIG